MKRFLLTFSILLPAISALIAQPSSFSPRGIGGGGALFSPSINPANHNEYYVACDMSELFHTTNFGATYSQVDFTQFMGGHNSKVCYTSTANLLYSIAYISDIGTPVKSTDNGVTWNILSGNPDATQDAWTIDVDYNNSNRVIISQYDQIYFSSNGGTSFTSIHTCINIGAGNVVGGVFFDGNNIYIGTNDGVLVSTNGGGTWTTATITGLGVNEQIWSFTAAKVGGTTRFFCLTSDAANVYVGVQGSDYWGFYSNVYKCDYGVTNWTAASTGITLNTDYPMFIKMAGTDINTVYVAGSNSNSEPNIMKSSNAGGSWTRVFNTANNQNIITGWSGQGGDRGWSYGECPFGFDVASNDPNVVLFGDYGFVHKTNNGGTTWKQAYTDTLFQHPANATTPPNQSYASIGLENTTCWQVNFIDANNVWSCYSDIKGIRSVDGGTQWSFNYTGQNANSSYRIAKGGNGTLYLATSGIHDMYQSTRLQDAQLDAADASGKLLYSTNNGATWTTLHSFGHPVFWIALDPNNPNRAYASVIHYNNGTGVGGVYICNDLNNLATSTWTLLPAPPRTEKHPASLAVLNDGKLVASFSGRRNSSGTFTASSGVFIYDPVGNSWTDVSDAGMDYWTKDVVIDPNDASQNTWYAGVYSGWGGPPNGLGGLYKTTNRGASWTKLTGTTLDRVESCTFNPSNANEIYLTTETQGLWMSSNINNVTPTFSLVNSYPFRQPERVFFNPYIAGEMWVSSFGNGMKVGNVLTTGIPDFSQPEISLYPNPASAYFKINSNKEDLLTIYNSVGEIVLSQQLIKGENEIAVNELAEGIYVVRVSDWNTGIVISR
ncbi:MAG: T9SS type A sorting domain-containing protein [Bacteroidetes bacterium]|nr:T9SS type A sorting domain-containing protein [Bacteroidota bacterium]